MKNCNGQILRIYEEELYKDSGETVYAVFPEEEITKNYYLSGFYYIDPDYDSEEESSDWNRKYRRYDEDKFTNDEEKEVFEVVSSITYQQENDALYGEDWSFFCNDDNFEKSAVCDYEEIFKYWDGSNWQTIVLMDYDGEAVAYTRRKELEECKYKLIYNSRNGQGQGHSEYFEIFDKEDNHLMFVHLPVSYFQGEQNNSYIKIKEGELPEEMLGNLEIKKEGV